MRSTEASYFARGQAMRVEELSRSIQKIKFMDILNFSDDDAIAVSAVVQLQYEDESCRWYFLVPDAGGHELVMEKKNIVTLATISPLGQALIGKNRDDSFDFNIRGKLQEIEITELY
jgi:transcription elongation GreA/GreB family factor